jgi:hypothetical protein
MNELLGKIILQEFLHIFLPYRTTLLSDIRRILYPPSIFNRTVYDFDAVANRSTISTLNNDDELR